MDDSYKKKERIVKLCIDLEEKIDRLILLLSKEEFKKGTIKGGKK